MAMTGTYLNFPGNTEQAFLFYKEAFRTEFAMPIQRMSDIPPGAEAPKLSDAEKKLVMHVALPIVGGHMLMGTDALESMGHKVVFGTNFSISLSPDSKEETDRLFKALGAGGTVKIPLQDMFWGAYFGALTDKFGVQWMFNCPLKK